MDRRTSLAVLGVAALLSVPAAAVVLAGPGGAEDPSALSRMEMPFPREGETFYYLATGGVEGNRADPEMAVRFHGVQEALHRDGSLRLAVLVEQVLGQRVLEPPGDLEGLLEDPNAPRRLVLVDVATLERIEERYQSAHENQDPLLPPPLSGHPSYVSTFLGTIRKFHDAGVRDPHGVLWGQLLDGDVQAIELVGRAQGIMLAGPRVAARHGRASASTRRQNLAVRTARPGPEIRLPRRLTGSLRSPRW